MNPGEAYIDKRYVIYKAPKGESSGVMYKKCSEEDIQTLEKTGSYKLTSRLILQKNEEGELSVIKVPRLEVKSEESLG